MSLRRAWTRTRAAVVLAAMLVASSLLAQPSPVRAERRARLVAADAFAVHLTGPLAPEAARGLDLLILDPDAHGTAIPALRAAGGDGLLVLAYLNVGETESYRWFADRVDARWTLADNPEWPDHRFVDAREPDWRALLVGTVAPRIAALGVDGLFLDGVDVGATHAHPETAPGLVALVRELRAAFPDLLLVVNRGVELLGAIGGDADGVLAEGVFADYDAATGAHRRTPDAERDRLVTAMTAFRDQTAGAAFVLDYPGRDRALQARSRDGAAAHGFPLYLGDRALAASPAPPPARRGW